MVVILYWMYFNDAMCEWYSEHLMYCESFREYSAWEPHYKPEVPFIRRVSNEASAVVRV